MWKKTLALTAFVGSAYAFWPVERDVYAPGKIRVEGQTYMDSLFKAWASRPLHMDSTVNPPLSRQTAVPSRENQVKRLASGEEFDLLIIGGGATGTGVALDAASRGLKVALVERDDFASGTSSRSTKLVHGGVRYLEKAFRNLDYEQYKLVREALHERAVFLKIAPHLSSQLPIMLPIYTWWQIPYYWVGAKAYDFFAGEESLESSYFLSRSKALERFPMLKRDHLCGAVVYYDGQHNDARMNVTLAMTAAANGAAIANHCEVIQLLHRPPTESEQQSITNNHPTTLKTGLLSRDPSSTNSENNKVVCGAQVKDHVTGAIFTIHAKGIINATGPFTDTIRTLDGGQTTEPIVCPSSGVHIVLPSYYAPRDMGLIDPSTSDGRVIFFLPWQNHTIAGTTDSPTEITPIPRPKEEEIQFILQEVSHYLDREIEVRRGDISSAWSGIRPLVKNLSSKKGNTTQELVRNHMVLVSDTNMITIAGGKWTTYRQMAKDAVDTAVHLYQFDAKPSCTRDLKLVGADQFHPMMFVQLIQMYGFEREVAEHLVYSYGDRAFHVAEYCQSSGHRWPVLGKKLHPKFPYLEEEVNYCMDHEYARTLVDVLARRTRMAFLDVEAADQTLGRLVDLMGDRLGWDRHHKKHELAVAKEFLLSMGLESGNGKSHFNAIDVIALRKYFGHLDGNSDGSVGLNDLRDYLKVSLKLNDKEIKKYTTKYEKKSYLDFADFLQMVWEMTSKGGPSPIQRSERQKISIERSGGGV